MPDHAPVPDGIATPLIATHQAVLIFGGCYSNLQATQTLLAKAGRLGVPPSRMICTGDIIAYGADPQATVDLIRSAGISVVMGNCEESLAADAPDCGCGFVPGSTCDRLSADWFSYATRHVDAAARSWMAALPRRIDLTLAGRHLAIVHGAPSRINRFIFASTPDADFDSELALAGTDGVIAGHCGLPFTRVLDGCLWHNAGAIGLPANDGTPRGWFSLLMSRGEDIEVRHLPLDYDYRSAARAMRAANLPKDYADAVESGIWPSFDILPAAEQSDSGRALASTALLWNRLKPTSLPA